MIIVSGDTEGIVKVWSDGPGGFIDYQTLLGHGQWVAAATVAPWSVSLYVRV